MNTSPKAPGKGRPRPSSAVLLAPTASAAAWLDQAACATADPEIFFPASGEPDAAAKQYCASCPVRDACRDYALAAGEEFGVWGGLNEAERRAIHAKARRDKATRPLGGVA
jgi:hypothetical protein